MDFCDDHLVGSSLLRTHIWFNLCTIMCIKLIGASLQFFQILGSAVGLNVLQGSRLGWGAVADDIIQSMTRVSISREVSREMTHLFLSRSGELNFHFSFFS